MAELTVAGWFVSPMVEAMVDKVRSYIESRCNWNRDVKEQLRKLEMILMQVRAAVDATERRQIKRSNSHKALARQLKDAVYDAEDLLDEFEYQVMKAQAQEEARSAVSHAALSSLKFGKRLIGRDKLRNKLIEILKMLESANQCAERLLQVSVGLEINSTGKQQEERRNGRVTGSILPDSDIFGREKEKHEIVRLLLEKADHEPESGGRKHIPVVIPILGIGGVGKTTLAQLVYNDTRTIGHFDTRMWVCVSDSFDEVRLTREILESASHGNGNKGHVLNFDTLQIEVETSLESRKFLLVLDDVWFDEERSILQNRERWLKLLAPLKHGAVGSKILVTTRMGIVATMFDATNWISLEGLMSNEYWPLFRSCAFGKENPDEYPELQDIGRQIANKLKGLPLAAKAIGGMLKNNLDVVEWKKFLEREILDDMMQILKLSYEKLPENLKHCFAYCSIFPKNWRFEPKKLVFIWIAQGYILCSARNERQMEDIGMEYFNELLSRSFFQKIERASSTSYVMHDLMHDLAESVSEEECSRIDSGKQGKIAKTVRHLGVVVRKEDDLKDTFVRLEELSNLKSLRTLIFFCSQWLDSVHLPQSLFEVSKSLRVLDFNDLHLTTTYHVAIGHLIHLYYLNLGHLASNCAFLPESFHLLYHLQVLVAPKGLSMSKSLIKLMNSNKGIHIEVPKLEFHIEKKRGVKLRELKDANVLRWPLHIKNLENVSCKEEANEASLESKSYMEELQLEWGYSESSGRHNFDVGVLEGLKPHPNLKRLSIHGFLGCRSPSWLETRWLTNLESICLRNCRRWEVLPPLGHLPCLRKLEVRAMHAMKNIGSEFYGSVDMKNEEKGFPSLEVLEFVDMLEWLEWSDAEFPVFPCLRELWVRRCPKLMRFPRFPPSLMEVNINATGLISYLELRCRMLPLSPARFLLRCSVIPCATLLHDHYLGAIEELQIMYCKEPMPVRGLQQLVSLKKLVLFKSSGLLLSTILDEEEGGSGVLPSSLESLEINGCCLTERRLSRCLQGLTSLSYLELKACSQLTTLPSVHFLCHLTSLHRLCISECNDLSSLGGLRSLVTLKHLEVVSCLDLMKLLPEEGLPESLGVLELIGCGIPDESLSRCLECLTSLTTLKIHQCCHLSSLPGAKVLCRLVALRDLDMEGCLELSSLGGLHSLASLKFLRVVDCPKMNSLPEEGLPTSVETLHLWGCDLALVLQMHEKEGPDWNKISHMSPNCVFGYNPLSPQPSPRAEDTC